MSGLYVLSLNVRGLREIKKRKAIFMYLKKKKADIIYLQETHSCNASEKQWKRDWGGEIIFSHGTNSSKGVAILINPVSKCTIDQVLCDPGGRYIVANVKMSDKCFNLINTYAPNDDKDQVKFFDNLNNEIENLNVNKNIIMGGDMNVAMDPLLDRKSKNATRDDHNNARVSLKRFSLKKT